MNKRVGTRVRVVVCATRHIKEAVYVGKRFSVFAAVDGGVGGNTLRSYSVG